MEHYFRVPADEDCVVDFFSINDESRYVGFIHNGHTTMWPVILFDGKRVYGSSRLLGNIEEFAHTCRQSVMLGDRNLTTQQLSRAEQRRSEVVPEALTRIPWYRSAQSSQTPILFTHTGEEASSIDINLLAILRLPYAVARIVQYHQLAVRVRHEELLSHRRSLGFKKGGTWCSQSEALALQNLDVTAALVCKRLGAIELTQ